MPVPLRHRSAGRREEGIFFFEVVDPSSSYRTALDLGLNPRFDHTATLLGSGEILIAGGGTNDGSILGSAAVLAPDLTSITNSQMAKARKQHRATLLEGSGCGMNCNRVLVTGGVGADLMHISLAAAEFFDPATGQWSDAGLLSTGRYRHTATLLRNGKVLVTGGTGSDSSIASAELFDPAIALEPQESDIPSGANGVWLPAQSMEFARAGHTASVLPDGNILVVGGEGPSGGPVAEAEIYNVNSGTWQRAGDMPFPTSLHSANVLPDGRVLVVGGVGADGEAAAGSQIYSNGEWSVGEDMESPRMHHTATDLPSGKVLVAGGSLREGFTVRALKSAELFDPLGSSAPPTPIPPLITEVDPSSGPVSGGTPATILGSGFTNATQVLFGSHAASSFKINSDEQITAVSPHTRRKAFTLW